MCCFRLENAFFATNLGQKLYKFGKKVIAVDGVDDYYNEFGYKD